MTVVTEQRGRILIVRIDRPAKRNAIDRPTAEALEAALDRLDDDPGLWVGILTGSTEVFSAGTDLSANENLRTPRGGEYGVIRRSRDTPLIAAVEGPAFGGGFEIALACDMVVASTTARFALPEARRGLVATSGALFRATRMLPPNVAREMLLSGRTIGAERAYELGIVSELAEPGQALEQAMRLAEDVCLCSPMSTRTTLRALRDLSAAEDVRGWELTEQAVAALLNSSDMREGISAFFEKRLPQWQGR
ncbi:enoyl-CoA hydratase-related protein [Rhodococcus indonesiensis]